LKLTHDAFQAEFVLFKFGWFYFYFTYSYLSLLNELINFSIKPKMLRKAVGYKMKRLIDIINYEIDFK